MGIIDTMPICGQYSAYRPINAAHYVNSMQGHNMAMEWGGIIGYMHCLKEVRFLEKRYYIVRLTPPIRTRGSGSQKL